VRWLARDTLRYAPNTPWYGLNHQSKHSVSILLTLHRPRPDARPFRLVDHGSMNPALARAWFERRDHVSNAGFDIAATFAQLSNEMDELKRQKEVIEGQIAELKARMQPVEQLLLETFAESGGNNVSIHGKLLYLYRQIWARPRDGNYERACDVLREVGLESFVKGTCNINTISAYVREQDELGGELPKGFTDAFKIDEEYHVRARKS
jgi:hypothetical protein